MNHFRASRDLFGLMTRHRALTWEMTKREISDRYVGQLLGTTWAVTHPLFLMMVYAVVFTYVFQFKIGGTREMPLDYTAYLLAGLIPWMTIQESMSKAAVSITSHSNLVKQVVFPVEILPVKGVLASFISQLIATVLLVAYAYLKSGVIHATFALLPILFFIQILGMIGMAFFLAALGTYFRDVKDFVQVFTLACIYLMPIFYLPQWVPDRLKPLIYLNPFSYMAWAYQDVCYYGDFRHEKAWIIFPVGCLAMFYIGYRFFRKFQRGFGSVL